MEVRRRCGWLDEEKRGEERVVWASRHAGRGGERLAASECPVSLITGESRASLDEWAAARRLEFHGELRTTAARTVDAWLTLDLEREGMETTDDAG